MAEIIHELHVDATPAEVREALTTRDGLAAFWTDQTAAEPEVGSKAWFAFGPNADIQKNFEVTAIDDRTVEWVDIEDASDEWVGTRVTWRLTPDADGTKILFTHSDWRSTEGELPQCSFVWGQVLARLASYLESGTPDPVFRQAG
jgi:uncharacterized protein YndB with AHSA1/START domain